jgi:hypothetical protein
VNPSQVAKSLRIIASKIENSKSPDIRLVNGDLKLIISALAPLETREVALDWEEPESGASRDVWSLPSWEEVESIISWVKSYWENHDTEVYGNTVASCELRSTNRKGKSLPIKDAILQLASDFRYDTGEGLYEEDCPVFRQYNISRQ